LICKQAKTFRSESYSNLYTICANIGIQQCQLTAAMLYELPNSLG
jgi:hypothetical protein